MTEKMSILSTNNILICINTCDRDKDSLSRLKDSDWYRYCQECSNIKIITYSAKKLEDGIDFNYIDSIRHMFLNTVESYDNLSIKTFKMLSACNLSFSFDFLLKVDCRIIDNLHNNTSDLFSFENFLKAFFNETLFADYGGFTPIIGTTNNSFRQWASSKKLFVLPEIFLNEIGINSLPSNYWAGGAYCLSSQCVEKIIKQTKLFESCKNLMGGCEDLCVGIAVNYERH